MNAVFLEAYWNAGSPVDQSRGYDDCVVRTAPIGPVVADARPVLLLRDPAGTWSAWSPWHQPFAVR